MTSSRKARWGWMFFDWASQPYHTLLTTVIFAPYFTSTIAASPEEGQTVWGYVMGASGLFIALSAPILGAVADATGPRKPWIGLFSLFYLAGAASLWFAVPGMEDYWWVLLMFGIGLIGVEYSTIFSNAMLPELAPKSEVGRLSGAGWALGYVGGVFSMAIMMLLFAEGDDGLTRLDIPPILGLDAEMREGTRAVGPFTAVWYAVFIIPFFVYVPDAPRRKKIAGAVSRALSELVESIRHLPKKTNLFRYLASSMLYRDALNGIYAFGGIYAAGVLGWSIQEISIFGLIVLITGSVGAWFGGIADSRMGSRPVILINIAVLSGVTLTILSITPSTVFWLPVGAESPLPNIVFYGCGILIGVCGGSLQAASRTMVVNLAPEERMTEAFGLYALAGKATAFLAPFLVALTTDWFDSQRVGIVPILFLFLIGLAIMLKVRAEQDA